MGASSAAAAPTTNEKDSTPSSSATALPVRDKDSFNKLMLDRYITHDGVHSSGLSESLQKLKTDTVELRGKIQEYKQVRTDFRANFPPSRLYGDGYMGYGNGFTELNGPSRIVYPLQKLRPGKRTTQPLRWKRKDMKQQAEQHEDLVPIRIDVEWENIKLRDTFTWNLHDRMVPVELFAAELIEDLAIKAPASQAIYEQVCNQIHEQLKDYKPHIFSEEEALDPEQPYTAYKNDDMRILIKLNITIGLHTLVDQFEWDINNPLNSPEEFAKITASELGLSGEFTTAIAHDIREQIQTFTQALFTIGHPFDGRPVEDPDLANALLASPMPSVFRPQQQAKDFQPYLYELSDAELDRNETIFSREQRRQKRSVNRRGGPQLPDLKERQRTIRTQIVSTVLPGTVTNADDSGLYKKAVGVPGTRKRPGARDGDLSESEESDDSTPDSPALSQLATGTARTRGLRGAANTAQQRMANIGRSETPEAASITHHHETRTASRRTGRDAREETEEPTQLIVKLTVNKEKLRKLLKDGKGKSTPTPSGSLTPSAPANTRIPSASTPAPAPATTMPPPPSTPSSIPPPKPKTGTPLPQGQIGRQPAPPHVPGQPQPSPVSNSLLFK
jgi:SWI/SNF-related matrix-associated actin-dependent regulator of chromatin subfamily B member 1